MESVVSFLFPMADPDGFLDWDRINFDEVFPGGCPGKDESGSSAGTEIMSVEFLLLSAFEVAFSFVL